MLKKSQRKQRSRLVDESVIRARCETELKERVKEFSKANKLTESDFVREAVEQYLAHIERGGGRYLVNPFSKEK